MTKYDRDHFVCHLCFGDKTLQEWIKEEGRKGGACPWCGRRGYLIPLDRLGEPFREVTSLYVQVEGPDAYRKGDFISSLLDDGWRIFSEQIQCNGLAQELAVSILYAGLREKERFDYPDYEGFFRDGESSLEDAWDEKAYAALSSKISIPGRDEAVEIEREIANDLPDQISIAFEDLAAAFEEGSALYRARVHDPRKRTERFENHELGAPPPKLAKAGRANREGEPVLYLASNKSTALAEVRAWKGATVALAEMRLRRRLLLVDLTRSKPFGSPFFVELLRWKVDLAALLRRLAEDMSRPVVKSEDEVLYKPTQLLAWLVRSGGYDGCKYPSAMGPGTNIVLFNPEDAEVTNITYVRVQRVAYFSEPLSLYETPYEEQPYDYLSSSG
jgi:RES domain-containing protein